jgi:hypothetical protein
MPRTNFIFHKKILKKLKSKSLETCRVARFKSLGFGVPARPKQLDLALISSPKLITKTITIIIILMDFTHQIKSMFFFQY